MRAALAFVLATACSSQRANPTTLRDTTGAAFAWRCSSSGCILDVLPESPLLPGDCPPGSTWGWVLGTLFRVCYFEPVAGGFAILGDTCRAIVCAKDDDCPWADFGGPTLTCIHGLCQSGDVLVDQPEVESLCLATDARPATCDVAKSRLVDPIKRALDVAASCAPAADACAIPASCRQP